MIRADRNSATAGGGVFALSARSLQARQRPEWCRADLESIWFTIPGAVIGSTRNVQVSVTYIPPDSKLPMRLQSFVELIGDIVREYPDDYYIVSGDFNLPCLRWDSDDPICIKKGSVEVQNSATNLLNVMQYLGFEQYNNFTNCSNNTQD